MRTYTNNAHLQHHDHHLLSKLHECNRATIGREGGRGWHMDTRSHTQTKTNKDKHRHIRVLANQDEGRWLGVGYHVSQHLHNVAM